MLITICSFIYLYYIFTDLMPVYKYEKPNVFWIYVSMLAVSYLIHLLIVLDVKLPSPATPIKILVEMISN